MTTAGSPVGIAEIAKADRRRVKTVVEALAARPGGARSTTASAAPAMNRDLVVSFLSCSVSGVSASSSPACSMCEMCPTSVAIPVDVTTNAPRPESPFVFMKDHVRPVAERLVVAGDRPRAPRERAWLSPVSADSATSSVAAERRRPSAGTTSPASTEDDVARYQLLGRDLDESPPRRTRALMINHLLERGNALRGLALLPQAEYRVEQCEKEEDEPGAELLQRYEAGRSPRRAARSASGRGTGARTHASRGSTAPPPRTCSARQGEPRLRSATSSRSRVHPEATCDVGSGSSANHDDRLRVLAPAACSVVAVSPVVM